MPCGLGSVGRKIRSLFTRRRNGRRSHQGANPEEQLGLHAETALVHPSAQHSAGPHGPPSARSLTPSIGQESQSRLIDPMNSYPPRLEPPVTRHPKRPSSTGGSWEAAPSPATMAEVTSPSRSTANRRENPNEQAESDALQPYPCDPYTSNPDHHRAASPSPQPYIASSVGPAPPPSHQAHGLPLPSSTTTGSPSYFPGASGFNIENQNIQNTNIGNQNIHNTNITPSRTVFEHLREHIVHGAAHDSNERCDAPACHEETRVAIRQYIIGWITHGDRGPKPKRIMWLSGPAGGGKTAIAGSVAEACKDQGLLAGTFMFSSFSGSPGRMSKRGVIVTLAYHMSQHKSLRLFAARLLVALEEHPDIFHKQLKEQAECLILTPFRSIDRGDQGGWPNAAIIVDGLDEVVAQQREDPTGRQRPRTSEEDQVEILEVLLTLSQSPSFPFRIFISSRPERNITQFFETGMAQHLTLELFLDSKYEPDTDIKLFLKSKFAEIRRRRRISDTWPGEDALSRLVDMSSGQFIVPTTIVRWVENGLPQQQLDEVLQLQQEISLSRNPFASLDALYRHILLRTHNPGNDPHLAVKWIILMNPNFGDRYSVSRGAPTIVWSLFLDDWEGEFNYRMEPMSSLVSIPPPHNTSSNVAFYHKSLLDFLSTKSRCGDDLYVDDTDMYPFIARRLLQTFKKKQVDVPFPLPDSCLQKIPFLVGNSNYNLSEYEKQKGIKKGFLLYEAPTPASKAALSACDVTWWVDLIFNTQGTGGLNTQLMGVIYCTIHKAMECNRHTPSSPEHSARKQTRDSQCHETCVRWRRDILTKVKELGWCVHRLEEIKVGELENVKWGQMEGLVENVGSTFDGSRKGCQVCRIPATMRGW